MVRVLIVDNSCMATPHARNPKHKRAGTQSVNTCRMEKDPINGIEYETIVFKSKHITTRSNIGGCDMKDGQSNGHKYYGKLPLPYNYSGTRGEWIDGIRWMDRHSCINIWRAFCKSKGIAWRLLDKDVFFKDLEEWSIIPETRQPYPGSAKYHILRCQYESFGKPKTQMVKMDHKIQKEAPTPAYIDRYNYDTGRYETYEAPSIQRPLGFNKTQHMCHCSYIGPNHISAEVDRWYFG